MLVGLHARNDQRFTQADWAIIAGARIEALKTLSLTADEEYAQLRQRHPGILIIERLYADMRGGPPSPAQFVADHAPRMVRRRDQFGVVDYEIHNEPNHTTGLEGWGQERHHAEAFVAWFVEVVGLLRQQVSGVRLGFPGLAVPHKDLEWLGWAKAAIEKADWLGCHVYWQTPGGQATWRDKFWGRRYEYYHEAFPGKPIHITEYGNSNGQSGLPLSRDEQAAQYVEWLNEASKRPYLKSACSFISTSPDPRWHDEGFAWASRSGELYPVVSAVASVPRQEPPTNGGVEMPDLTTPLGDQLAARLKARLGNRFQDLRKTIRRSPRWNEREKWWFDNIDSRGMRWIALHHSASPRATSPAAIADWHIDGRGFAGIGYHVVIERGTLYYVGDINTQRAHVAQQNDQAIGACITGDYTRSIPAAEDVELLRILVAELDALYGHKKELIGHKFVPNNGHTTCPGRMIELIPSLRAPAIDPFAGWTLGTGVFAEMKKRGDVPLSDELYLAGGQVSLTVGRKHLYIWSKEGQTLRVANFV